ncbi:DUF5685 family protein [Peptostreptococcus porci]|uniref:DUF5685 family protein n=1 Tax=Peptostreptococcus porci TaxID=2652282 RepID=UPI002A75A06E|nr:DUF5685 family protein [Peptostreptococcus porci]MDY2793780.1 DUF5685 family protein [Peptostreptococcus porci]MDY4560687.1 DUF5685 family protein [Peptostreptococcus porci]MDY5436578.1 DUF5685 family protein [Peptostreptococcus porci]MDY5479768.1 DUF5685 family protein [Peptostreptococcus porci]
MFGYVRINKMDLTFREFETYKAYYCGLCKYLKRNHTEISRLTLNYDITFLIVLLSSVYEPASEVYHEHCIVNPLKEKKHISNEITEYAASMNILLSYYKLQDNVVDDGGIKNKLAEIAYRKSYDTALKKYPEKARLIKENLDRLSDLEKAENTNIDEISNTFGNLMAEVFSYKDDEYTQRLKNVGFNIGKYIYILDAFADLDDDIKNKSYNPFISYKDDREALKMRVDKLISMILSRLEMNILSLDLNLNRTIIENILYSGVYLRYKGILIGVEDKKNM